MTVLPPVLGPLISSVRRSRVSSRLTGTAALPLPPQHVFEQRMARVAQQQPLAEARDRRNRTPAAKRALAKIRSSSAMVDQRLPDGVAVAAQAAGDLEQDAAHLARFFFRQAHQLVIQVDGFERLDEQRVAAGARAVDHAVQLAALAGDHRHHEALVADGDELFLQNALLAVGAQEALERFLDGLLLPLDIAAQAGQRDAGVVGDAAVGQDLALELFQQRAKIADGLRAPAQPREALGGGGEQRFGIGGAVEQREDVEDFLGLQAGAFDAQLVDGGLDVRQAAEIDADGRAARRRLRTRTPARRYSMASPASARSSSRRARSACGCDLGQLRGVPAGSPI